MNDNELNVPRILIISGAPLDDNRGISSTLVNFFANYNPDRIAQVYFETVEPHTRLCNRFFQISEIAQVKKFFKWNTQVGKVILQSSDLKSVDKNDVAYEQKIGKLVRKHRSILFYYIRELVWLVGFWRNKRLRSFVKDFDPDVIWCESYPLPFMHRLCMYIAGIVDKPSVIFLQDDVYSYKSTRSILGYVNRYFLRKVVKQNILLCSGHFVASPTMKVEYDKIFGINSLFVTKGLDIEKLPSVINSVEEPIRMVYMGNIIYGRIFTLLELAKTVNDLNATRSRFEVNIYTNNYLTPEQIAVLEASKGVNLCKPVPYNQVQDIMNNHDVVLFMESFDRKYKDIARLSFSTKITDCLASGKCIIAIGPSGIAPIDYLSKTDAAILINHIDKLEKTLDDIHPSDIVNYAKKARLVAEKNHSKNLMDARIFGELIRVSNIKHELCQKYQ